DRPFGGSGSLRRIACRGRLPGGLALIPGAAIPGAAIPGAAIPGAAIPGAAIRSAGSGRL
ncbi:MAG: hypothetical protein OXC00_06620, partial [Acidimicrobiaceae bacterium]|nr:hypothetical protein [Acidimicrobiaceae bacterium]